MITGKIKADFTFTRYKVIKEAAAEVGWKPYVFQEESKLNKKKKEEEAGVTTEPAGRLVDLFWHDLYISNEKLSSMKRFQRVNHFPAMSGVTKKNSLAQLLKTM